MKKILSTAAVALTVLALGALAPALAEDGVAKVGAPAPDFTLTDVEGNEHALSAYKGKVVVLEWFNPDCPFVVKHHHHNKTMQEAYAAYKDTDVVWLAINSGAPGKQGHGLERNQRAVEEYGIEYPVLLDETGEVGHSYGATNTPHMYVIDVDGVLRYAGAIDDDRSARKPGETNYVRQAVDAVLAGEEVPTKETRAYGCSVKYGKRR
jgi:peroxiredoxin